MCGQAQEEELVEGSSQVLDLWCCTLGKAAQPKHNQQKTKHNQQTGKSKQATVTEESVGAADIPEKEPKRKPSRQKTHSTGRSQKRRRSPRDESESAEESEHER